VESALEAKDGADKKAGEGDHEAKLGPVTLQGRDQIRNCRQERFHTDKLGNH